MVSAATLSSVAAVLLAGPLSPTHGLPISTTAGIGSDSGSQPADRAARAAAEHCCSFGDNICGASDDCSASQSVCEGACGGSWTSVALSNKMTALLAPNVCDADTSAGDTAAHACMDWNVGSEAMVSAADEYAEEAGLSGSNAPIFAVGTAGSSDAGVSNLGLCFKLTLAGVQQPVIVQAINTGSDVSAGDFDLQMAAGGEGLMTGCTAPAGGAAAMFDTVGAYPSAFGTTASAGGPATKAGCADLPSFPSGDSTGIVFDAAGETDLVEQCEDSFELGLRTNPTITARSLVACPSQLYEITGLRRADESQSAQDQTSSHVFPGSHATRMMDCCKPAGGWAANVPNADPQYPGVMSCRADGLTRMDFESAVTGFGSWRSGKKCKSEDKRWLNVENGSTCQAHCKAHADANGYGNNFCCGYKTSGNNKRMCKVARDGNTNSKSDSRWKKSNGQL